MLYLKVKNIIFNYGKLKRLKNYILYLKIKKLNKNFKKALANILTKLQFLIKISYFI